MIPQRSAKMAGRGTLAANAGRMRISRHPFIVASFAVLGAFLQSQAQNLYLAQGQWSPYVTQFTTNGDVAGQFVARSYSPTGLAFDRSGNLFVSDGSTGIITKFSPRGRPLIEIRGTLSVTGIATDASGNLYATRYNDILKISTNGESSVFGFLDGHPGMIGVVVDTNGYVYASTMFWNTIEKFGPDGTYLGAFATNTMRMEQPGPMAFDSKGNLYVGNTAGANVMRFSPSGESTVISGPELSWPSGLAFDPAGSLFVADEVNGTIEKYSSDGVYLGSIATNLPAPMALVMQVIPEILPWSFRTINNNSNSVQMTWDAVVGQLYQIQYKTNFLQTDWSNLGTPVTATNNLMSYSSSVGLDAQRYYRAQLIP